MARPCTRCIDCALIATPPSPPLRRRQDDHTRSAVLRGGSNYRPQGSHWYFPQSLELDTYEKYFLMDHRYERAGTIGFPCVVDAAH